MLQSFNATALSFSSKGLTLVRSSRLKTVTQDAHEENFKSTGACSSMICPISWLNVSMYSGLAVKALLNVSNRAHTIKT